MDDLERSDALPGTGSPGDSVGGELGGPGHAEVVADEAVGERARAVVDGMMARDAFSRWLGVTVLSVAPGRVSVSMTVRDDMVNGFRVAHGGIAFSLADSAMAFAANTHGFVSVALDNTITYPKPVHSGEHLRATAVERTATKRTAVYDVTVERVGGIQNELVALFRGTVYRTRKEHEID